MPSRSRWIVGMTLAGLLSAASESLAEEDRKIGCDSIRGWYYNDLDERIVEIPAKVVSIKKNSPPPFYDDGDWNIWIRPDSGFERYAKNPQSGRINSRDDGDDVKTGDIELEVQSPPGAGVLPLHFPAGSRVRGLGHWVHDNGHSGKTELHPLISLIGIDSTSFSWFVAQDHSERFRIADWAVWDFRSFVMRDGWTTVTPGQVVVSHSRVLEQDVISLSGGSLVAQQTPGAVSAAVGLEGQVPGCLGGGWSGTSPTHSVFLAKYDYGEADLIADSMTFSLVPDVGAPGRKSAIVKINATLNSPPQGALRKATWYYRSTSGLAGDQEVVTTCAGPTPPECKHSFSISEVYAPYAGEDDHEWQVAIVAATKEAIDTQSSNEGDAVFVQDGRRYYLPISKIRLEEYDKRADPNALCSTLIYVDEKDDLIPGAARTALTWSALEVVDANGTPTPGFQFVTPPPNNLPLQPLTSGAIVVGPSTTTKLSAGGQRAEVSFRAPIPPSKVNRAVVLLQAKAETDLGEKPSVVALVDANCLLGTFTRGQVMSLMRRLLHQRGYPLELYELEDHLRPADRVWGHAFLRWLDRGSLDSVAERALVGALRAATQLPEPREPGPRPSKHVLQPPKIVRGVALPFARRMSK